MAADPAALAAALGATWPPAEAVRLGSWTLRRGAGGGNRTTAATLDGPPESIDLAAAAMRAWGQRPLFMIRAADAALDADLAERGYAVKDPTLLLAAPVTALADGATDGAIPVSAPLACMAEIWTTGGIGPARLAVMARAPEPRLYLLGRHEDRPSGCAFAAIHRGIAMVHALEIAPFARRQGVAARLMRAAAAWAAGHHAAILGVAVTRANAPARALYAGLGMTPAGAYHYRVAPDEPPGDEAVTASGRDPSP